MIVEIIVLVLVGRHIASLAREKKRKPVGYVLLLVGCYLGGAFSFCLLGWVLADAIDADEKVSMALGVMGYLIGVGLGVGLTYLIVWSLPPIRKRRRRRRYDDDDYDHPRRRRFDEIEDEEEEHDRLWSRRRDYDDSDDRPRRGRRDDYE
jgi:hypothetical protein